LSNRKYACSVRDLCGPRLSHIDLQSAYYSTLNKPYYGIHNTNKTTIIFFLDLYHCRWLKWTPVSPFTHSFIGLFIGSPGKNPAAPASTADKLERTLPNYGNFLLARCHSLVPCRHVKRAQGSPPHAPQRLSERPEPRGASSRRRVALGKASSVRRGGPGETDLTGWLSPHPRTPPVGPCFLGSATWVQGPTAPTWCAEAWNWITGSHNNASRLCRLTGISE
jgi:hypothetical protein